MDYEEAPGNDVQLTGNIVYDFGDSHKRLGTLSLKDARKPGDIGYVAKADDQSTVGAKLAGIELRVRNQLMGEDVRTLFADAGYRGNDDGYMTSPQGDGAILFVPRSGPLNVLVTADRGVLQGMAYQLEQIAERYGCDVSVPTGRIR